ncbi:WD40 repeat domain-containing protein [Acaryochloris marina]|nr:WD40 repeat domain-containing protein [Acaryochloris marina]
MISIAFGPSSQRLASASQDKTVKLWGSEIWKIKSNHSGTYQAGDRG